MEPSGCPRLRSLTLLAMSIYLTIYLLVNYNKVVKNILEKSLRIQLRLIQKAEECTDEMLGTKHYEDEEYSSYKL